MEVPFAVHDGTELFNMKIERNNVTIQIFKREEEIHAVQQQMSDLFRKSLNARIKLVEEMTALERKQIENPTVECNMEIIRLTTTVNIGMQPDDEKQLHAREARIAELRTEIDSLSQEFMRIDSTINQITLVNVIKGKIRIPSVAEQYGLSEADLRNFPQ